MLRKPGKMRWDYSQPKGKLFVSDGKFLWLYTPDENRVEKMKLKESEDMRAPLAFLLGKLDFDKEFQQHPGEAGGFRYADHGRAEDGQPALFGRGVRGDARTPMIRRGEGDRASTTPILDFRLRPGAAESAAR